MNETMLCYIPFVGVIILSFACLLYAFGGRSGKWKRRFIGSLICATALWIEFLLMGLFQWVMLVIYPLTIGAFSLGYGSEIPFQKVVKRTVIVAASLFSSLGICLLIGGKAWLILPVEVLIAATSIWLGVKNPIQAAPEEFFICLFLWTPKLMYPFVGNII